MTHALPQRVADDLVELAELTSDADGAQRLTWTPPWYAARAWLRSNLAELPVDLVEDQAGNLWATLPGRDRRAVILGSHLDSVPAGGPLDGCLGVVAGLEVLRRIAGGGVPPLTVRLVDFAEEEGDRSNHSLLGSTAAAGMVDVEHLKSLRTMEGERLGPFLAARGIDVERMNEAAGQLEQAAAFLELHIEQSTTLETAQLPLGVVEGTAGVERCYVHFSGRRDHTARPMDERRDALMATCRFIVELRDLARSMGSQSLASHVTVEPNIQLIVADEAGTTFDVRAFDVAVLERLGAGWRELAARIAREENVGLRIEPRWAIAPARFDAQLIDLAEEAVDEVCGAGMRMGSPQLHDAGQVALAGVPTVMLFVQSVRGLSHSPDERSQPEHLTMAVEALDRLATKVIDLLSRPREREDGAVAS